MKKSIIFSGLRSFEFLSINFLKDFGSIINFFFSLKIEFIPSDKTTVLILSKS